MTVLVNSLVSCKKIAQMGVRTNLITTAPPTAESHRVHDGRRILLHEAEVRARSICEHGGLGRFISSWLADNVAKAL